VDNGAARSRALQSSLAALFATGGVFRSEATEASEERALPVRRGADIRQSDRDRAGAFWNCMLVSSTLLIVTLTANDRAGAF
jgi:hypothetical protein